MGHAGEQKDLKKKRGHEAEEETTVIVLKGGKLSGK